MTLVEAAWELNGYVPEQRLERLECFCKTHHISSMWKEALYKLDQFEIVIIADDSGSMNMASTLGHQTTTRWQELQASLSVLVDLAVIFDDTGVDVHFLNRDPLLQVKSSDILQSSFKHAPQGLTPLTSTLCRVLNTSCRLKRLIFIFTDGEPTEGVHPISTFKNTLEHGRDINDYITIMACTNEDKAIGYLNAWDRQIPRLDVVDDYESELKQVRHHQGVDFTFTHGDYIVKSLIGAINPAMDHLDEFYRRRNNHLSCCTLL